MFAMAGASPNHNRLVKNLMLLMDPQLSGKPFELFPSDLRVHVSATGLYTYPDALVVCGEQRYVVGTDTLLNPIVIIEVLLPSTEAYDRGRKFEHYRAIESLCEYLLVDSQRMHADLYRRQADGTWSLIPCADAIELHSVDCRLTLADLYRRVELA